MPPAVLSLAILLELVLGEVLPVDAEHAQGWALALDAGQPHNFAAILGVVFFTFWFGPLPEEVGWRGFALDRLQCRISALSSSVVLGTIWALWHLPLFFVPWTYQYDVGLGTVRFWLFLAHFLPLSVLMTWIYNSTHRSTLSAILFHFSGNLCVALLPTTDRIAAFELLVLTGAALLVSIVYGRAQLCR
jgi:membrane protease YdiL (CAAX protease family)